MPASSSPGSLANCQLWLKADAGGGTPWTDSSGNGRTAAVSRGAPTLVNNVLNGLPGVLFDNNSFLVALNVLDASYNTAITVVSLTTTNISGGVFFGAMNSSGFFCSQGPLSNEVYLGSGGNITTRGATPFGKPMVQVARYDGANIKLRTNAQEIEFISSAASINVTGSVAIGGQGAITSAGWFLGGYMFEFALFNRSLSDAEVKQVEQYLRDKWNVLNRPRVLFIMDSFYQLHGANITTPQLTSMNCIGSSYGLDAAVIGRSGMAMTNAESQYSPRIDPDFRSGETVIMVIQLCVNDLYTGTTGAALWTIVQNFCTARRAAAVAAGATLKIILHTVTPTTGTVYAGGQAAYDVRRSDYLALIRAGWAGSADGLADIAANVNMGPPTAASNTTYYVDGVHPADPGNQLLGVTWASAILTVLGKKSLFVVVSP